MTTPSVNRAWRPPAQSTRSRNWNRKTDQSGRAVFVTPDWREQHCESLTEGDAAVALNADPRVARVDEQPPKVSFIGQDGKRHCHTIDLLATMRDGSKVAHLVKPMLKAEKEDLDGLIKLLAAQVPRSVADRWNHLHEGKLTRDVKANGHLLMGVRREGPFSEDPTVMRMAAIVDRPMRIGDAVREAGVEGAFRAIARLLLDERLIIDPGVRIDLPAWVRPAPTCLGGAA